MFLEQHGDQPCKKQCRCANAQHKGNHHPDIKAADAGGKRLEPADEDENGGRAEAGNDKAESPQQTAQQKAKESKQALEKKLAETKENMAQKNEAAKKAKEEKAKQDSETTENLD